MMGMVCDFDVPGVWIKTIPRELGVFSLSKTLSWPTVLFLGGLYDKS